MAAPIRAWAPAALPRCGNRACSCSRRARRRASRLIAAAAARWGVAPEACVARAGSVWHDASDRSAAYGELAPEAAKISLKAEPAIKTPDQFKLIGTRAARLDTPLKVNGEAKFGIDTRVPDMVYAAVANCPVFGGKLKSFDEAAIKDRRGFIAVVPVENGVAVVADRFWRAKEALAALPIVWDFGEAATTNSEMFRADYRAALDGPLVNAVDRGRRRRAPSRAPPRSSMRSTKRRIWRMRRWSR